MITTVMACWPEEKNIPVLSTSAVDRLLTKDIIELREEGWKIPFNCYGEDILRLKCDKNYYEIPVSSHLMEHLLFEDLTTANRP